MQFILGIIVGLLIATLNLLAYKPEVKRQFMKITNKKGSVIDTSDPIDFL